MKFEKGIAFAIAIACAFGLFLPRAFDLYSNREVIVRRNKNVTVKHLRQGGPVLFPSISPPRSIPWVDRELSESYYPPTYSFIDVSYDGYVGTKPKNYDNSLGITTPRSEREPENIADAEAVTPPANLATLPIFVIGFSGTILMCSLGMLLSEFRERRRLNKGRIMRVRSMSESSDLGSTTISERSSLFQILFLGAGSGSQSTGGSIIGGENPSVKPPGANAGDKGSRLPTIPASMFDSDSFHRGYYYYYSAAKKGNEQDCDHRFNWAVQPFLSDPDQKHQHRDVLIYRTDECSLSATSTITKSLPLDSSNNNCAHNAAGDIHHRPCNNEKIMELTEIHRVSTGITLESLVELGTIPATSAAVVSSAPSPSPGSNSSEIPNEEKGVATRGVSQTKDHTRVTGKHSTSYDSCGNEDNGDNNDHEVAVMLLQKSAVSDSRDLVACSVSAFDAGTEPVAEAMAYDDYYRGDDSDDHDYDGLVLPTLILEEDHNFRSGINYCEESVGKSFASNAEGPVSDNNFALSEKRIGRYETTESEEKGEFQSQVVPPIMLLGEGSLVALAKLNGYTRLEPEYQIAIQQQEDDAEESKVDNYIGDADPCERREYEDGDCDSLRSSSSMDASTATNSNQEYRIHPDESSSIGDVLGN